MSQSHSFEHPWQVKQEPLRPKRARGWPVALSTHTQTLTSMRGAPGEPRRQGNFHKQQEMIDSETKVGRDSPTCWLTPPSVTASQCCGSDVHHGSHWAEREAPGSTRVLAFPGAWRHLRSSALGPLCPQGHSDPALLSRLLPQSSCSASICYSKELL